MGQALYETFSQEGIERNFVQSGWTMTCYVMVSCDTVIVSKEAGYVWFKFCVVVSGFLCQSNVLAYLLNDDYSLTPVGYVVLEERNENG